ncbi:MAG: cysteine--tRNA ligase [Fusobacteriota bacterium]
MIKIHDTMKNKLTNFIPKNKDEVNMYVCGPTVYNRIHIGNARPIIFFDTVRRYLEYEGYNVKYVQNFTDIDDKMIKKANEEGVSVKEIADRYIEKYFEDTKDLNIDEKNSIHPRATDNIQEMINLVKDLENKDYAYENEGDLYFRVKKFKDYGKLSHQNIENLKVGARIEENLQKEDPIDFTLWKKSKKGEPSWKSPWGKGRPGWHLECSVMSKKYLGDTFDIHGGGQDLIFPHHENEIAQSEALTGKTFAKYWMHNGYLNINGEKMSKSEGNFFLLKDILEKYEGRVIRFFMLSSHYRNPIDFNEEEMSNAQKSLERIENTIFRIDEFLGQNEDSPTDHDLKSLYINNIEEFKQAMDTDFNTAKALGVIFKLIKEVNKKLSEDKAKDQKTLSHIKDFIIDIMQNILGVKLNRKRTQEDNLTGDLVELLLDIRMKAKKEKNWGLADEIRDRLKDLDIEIKDGKEKSSWSIKR